MRVTDEIGVNALVLASLPLVARAALIWLRFLRRLVRARIVAEEDYRGIFENAVEGMFQTTPAGRYLAVNPALARIYGFDSPEELVAHFSDIAHQLYVDPSRRAEFKEIMERDGAVSSFESEVFRRNGERIWISENARAVRARNGSIARYEGTVVDITSRRAAEEALRRAKDAAEEASRLKAEFLATMSHELRTPMNAVLGMTRLLLDTELTPDQREMGTTVHASAESLLAILNDILDFSKIEAGKMEFESVELEPRRITEDTIDLLSESAHRKGLDIVYAIDPAVPWVVRGDPNRVRQVLVNLVGNAIKFTESGEVVIRVGLVDRTAAGPRIRFSVSDTGIGIAPRQRRKLFDAFTQADGSMSRRYGGTGLGLTISRQLVQRMDGEIGVDSAPKCGSTFWFAVQFADPPDPDDLRAPPQPRLEGERILVVDDSLTTREILDHQLRRWGARPATADGASAAVAALRAAARSGSAFQTALVDGTIADGEGRELVAQIRDDPSCGRPRIILMIALGEVARLPANDAVDVLHKPVRPDRVLDLIVRKGPPRPASVERIVAQGPFDGEPEPDSACRPALRVLVAEDNVVNQNLMVRVLRKLGYSSVVVATGHEALEAVERESIDLVLMDCQMPEMDGFEATRRLRERERGAANGGDLRRLPIVALTANAAEGDRERCLACGMDDYLPKPVRVEELRDVLERHFIGARRGAETAEPSSRGPAPETQSR